jgi:chromosome partitioning protein
MQDTDMRGAGPLRVIPRTHSRSVLIANSKGGCGKTTLATNLASYFANRGRATALMDFDPQGSSAHWLKLRPESAAPVSGISAFSQQDHNQTRSFKNRLPWGIERVVVDSPAGLAGTDLYHRISESDLVIIPILPSPIDIHSAANFIRDIQLTGILRERNKQLLVIANRVRTNTVMFRKLSQFLQQLGLPGITCIHDSQLYTRSAAQGLGISDIARSQAIQEKDRWVKIGCWIEDQFAIQARSRESAVNAQTDQFTNRAPRPE